MPHSEGTAIDLTSASIASSIIGKNVKPVNCSSSATEMQSSELIEVSVPVFACSIQNTMARNCEASVISSIRIPVFPFLVRNNAL